MILPHHWRLKKATEGGTPCFVFPATVFGYDSSVGLLTELQAERLRSLVSNPCRCKDISFFLGSLQTGSGACPTSCLIDGEVLVPIVRIGGDISPLLYTPSWLMPHTSTGTSVLVNFYQISII
jgi:hypothetical protein